MATTLKKLLKNKCYCIKKGEDIKLEQCSLFDCSRWKKCMQQTNKEINKDLKKKEKGGKNGKTSQK